LSTRRRVQIRTPLGPALKQRAPDNDASADLPASRTMKRSRNFSTGP
jgi:hypothetical protein